MKYTSEQEDALVRRLNDGGCPVLRDDGYKIRPVGLAIESIPGATFNRIFPLARGGTGYYFDVVLRNETDHPITIWGFQIKTPWGVPRYPSCPRRKNHPKGTRSIVSRSPGLIAKASMRSIPSSLGTRACCLAMKSRGASSPRLERGYPPRSRTLLLSS